MINPIGKIGRININANKILKKMFWNKDITRCENCSSTYILTFAHRHKRHWYRKWPELLSSFNQVLLLCHRCHNEIEYDKEKTSEIFLVLRGDEKLPE